MSQYENTHKEFSSGPMTIEQVRVALRRAFGDTDHMTPLTQRKWFTLGNEFYVARDSLDQSFITWLLLHQ